MHTILSQYMDVDHNANGLLLLLLLLLTLLGPGYNEFVVVIGLRIRSDTSDMSLRAWECLCSAPRAYRPPKAGEGM